MMAKKTVRKKAPKKVPQYFLRTTAASGISGGQELGGNKSAPTIKWPKKPGSVVSCTDWKPTNLCGNGIHGYLFGEGKGDQLSQKADAIWQVVETCGDVVHIEDGVDIGDKKCKAEKVILRFSGKREDAIAWLVKHAPGHKTYKARVIAGDNKTAVAGNLGIATAGNGGTAIVGDFGVATTGSAGKAEVGDYGFATVGDGGFAIAMYRGVAVSGSAGISSAGYYGIAFSKNSGKAEAGSHGIAVTFAGVSIAGESGLAVTRDYGSAQAGPYGVALSEGFGDVAAGKNGIIVIRWNDGKRLRLAVGYVGEDGIEPNTSYVVANGKFIKKNGS